MKLPSRVSTYVHPYVLALSLCSIDRRGRAGGIMELGIRTKSPWEMVLDSYPQLARVPMGQLSGCLSTSSTPQLNCPGQVAHLCLVFPGVEPRSIPVHVSRFLSAH